MGFRSKSLTCHCSPKWGSLAASVPTLLAFLPWLLTYKFLWEKPFIKCLNKATAREKATQAQKDGDSLYLCLLRRTSAVGGLPKPSGSKHLSRMGLEPELNKQHSRRRKKSEVWWSEFSESYSTFPTLLASVYSHPCSCTVYFYQYVIAESEKAMAPHSSTLAWKIPWTEEPGRLQSMGSRRVGHDWVTSLSLFTFMHWRRKWQPAPVFLPGESQGRGSLVGFCLWGRTESDTTEAT